MKEAKAGERLTNGLSETRKQEGLEKEGVSETCGPCVQACMLGLRVCWCISLCPFGFVLYFVVGVAPRLGMEERVEREEAHAFSAGCATPNGSSAPSPAYSHAFRLSTSRSAHLFLLWQCGHEPTPLHVQHIRAF